MLSSAVSLSDEQKLIKSEIGKICDDFDAEYWRSKSRDHEYPTKFVNTLAENGWLGVLIPEEYGGAEMGTAEAIVMLEEIAASGAGFGGAQTIHGAIYTSRPLVKYGSEEMKEDLLPKFARGEETMQSMALTEPNAGTNSTAIETRAERDGDEYVVNGKKVWISRVDQTDYLLLVARTTPIDEVEKRTRGISLFLVDVEDAVESGGMEMSAIPKTAVNMSNSFELWFSDLRIPAENLIGEEDEGFYHILDGLNDERLVTAAESIGLGILALERGVNYAKERRVFDRAIGQNQAIQHPLAKSFAKLTAAKQVTYNAAMRSDDLSREELGEQANVAKYLAAEAAFETADAAVQTHGGFGVAREYDVERYLRNARLTRIAPISQEMVLNFLSHNTLGLPKSY
jgi:acyl-CoA dehydrogenase